MKETEIEKCIFIIRSDSQDEQQNKHIFWLPNYSRHICEK